MGPGGEEVAERLAENALRAGRRPEPQRGVATCSSDLDSENPYRTAACNEGTGT